MMTYLKNDSVYELFTQFSYFLNYFDIIFVLYNLNNYDFYFI